MRGVNAGLATLAALMTTAMLQTASAADNDPALYRLCEAAGSDPAHPCGDNPVGDTEAFTALAKGYGVAIAPRLLAPAETLGVNGFEFNAQMSITDIDDAADHWQRGIEDESPPAILLASTMEVRKGLPYSFEVGGGVTYLVSSEMWAFNGSLKWALNEAVDAFPIDAAVRGSVSRLTGSPQLEMTNVGLDLVLSKGFGVGGMTHVAPYASYSPLWISARSGVLDSSPGDGTDPERSFVFAEDKQLLHRFVVGTRFVIGVVNFTPEFSFADGVRTYSTNLGLHF